MLGLSFFFFFQRINLVDYFCEISIDSKELYLGWLAYNFLFNLCKIDSRRWVAEYLLEKFVESFIGRLKIKYVEGSERQWAKLRRMSKRNCILNYSDVIIHL